MAHGLHDVARAGLTLGADQGRPLGDAAQRFAQVGGPAHEGHREGPLVDVMRLVGRREHLALVDVVDAERLEHLRLGEVPDARLGHHRDGDRPLDLLDEGGVAHPRHAALGPDVGRHALERHDRHRPGVLGDAGVLGGDHVHDHPAAQHVGQTPLDRERAGASLPVAGRTGWRGGAVGRGDGRVVHGVSLLGGLRPPFGAPTARGSHLVERGDTRPRARPARPRARPGAGPRRLRPAAPSTTTAWYGPRPGARAEMSSWGPDPRP